MLSRMLLALVVVAATVPEAAAKDLCIQVDAGSRAGSQIVVKNAKLGRRKVAAAAGYLAIFSGGFTVFQPMAGGSMVASNGDLALGMTLYPPSVGGGGSAGGHTTFNCFCFAGPDQKIGVLDFCSLYFDTSGVPGHVVPCTSLIAIP